VSSLVVEASGLDVFVGELCHVDSPQAPGGRCRAEVVGLKEDWVDSTGRRNTGLRGGF
jgi:flagellar biosynthesis/type III secretory pathway ATPase